MVKQVNKTLKMSSEKMTDSTGISIKIKFTNQDYIAVMRQGLILQLKMLSHKMTHPIQLFLQYYFTLCASD